MTNSRADAHKSWMVRFFPSALGISTASSSLQQIQSISHFVITKSAFRSSRSELFCKKVLLKILQNSQVFPLAKEFSVNFVNFKENLFWQNTYSGCYWHLHQLRSPNLILYIINQQLTREYV